MRPLTPSRATAATAAEVAVGHHGTCPRAHDGHPAWGCRRHCSGASGTPHNMPPGPGRRIRPPATTRPHTRSVTCGLEFPPASSFLSFFFSRREKGRPHKVGACGQGPWPRRPGPAPRSAGERTMESRRADSREGGNHAGRLSPPIAYLLCCSRWSYHSVGSLVGRMPSKVKKLPNLTSQIPSSLYFYLCGVARDRYRLFCFVKRSLPAF